MLNNPSKLGLVQSCIKVLCTYEKHTKYAYFVDALCTFVPKKLGAIASHPAPKQIATASVAPAKRAFQNALFISKVVITTLIISVYVQDLYRLGLHVSVLPVMSVNAE